MICLLNTAGPTTAELLAIEAESDLIMAELALVGAECAWYLEPAPSKAADLLVALADVTDIYYLAGHEPAAA